MFACATLSQPAACGIGKGSVVKRGMEGQRLQIALYRLWKRRARAGGSTKRAVPRHGGCQLVPGGQRPWQILTVTKHWIRGWVPPPPAVTGPTKGVPLLRF